MFSSVRSFLLRRRRLRRPVIIAFSVLVLSVAFASVAFAAATSYTFVSGAEGWTGATWMAAGADLGWAETCDGCLRAVPAATFVGPSQTVPANALSLDISYSAKCIGDNCGAGALAYQLQYGGVAAGSVCNVARGTGPTTCTVHIASPGVAGSSEALAVAVGIGTTSAGPLAAATLDNVVVTYNIASPGTMAFPALDLSAISTQMGGFFAFIAPALWVAIGISLGGYIAAKVRGIL